MKKRKLKFNTQTIVSSGDSYISEPAVIEAKDYRRLVFAIIPKEYKSDDGKVVEVLDIHFDSRAIEYFLDKKHPAVDFNEKSGTAEFTSNGTQYKIRALQEDDKSWIINFSLPEETENS
jgi:hypothetical protein